MAREQQASKALSQQLDGARELGLEAAARADCEAAGREAAATEAAAAAARAAELKRDLEGARADAELALRAAEAAEGACRIWAGQVRLGVSNCASGAEERQGAPAC
jgi:hypothetical protein